MGIDKFTPIGLQSDSSGVLASWLGVAQPVTLDVVGFYSYADVVEDVVDDPASNETGVEVNASAGRGNVAVYAAGDGPDGVRINFSGRRNWNIGRFRMGSLADIRASVDRLFEVYCGDSGRAAVNRRDGDREGGRRWGAYAITVESYNPAFPMFGTHEVVQALTLHVVHGKREFWRMILGGRALQTDFKMDPATTPPMVKGNRQKEPIDKDLVLGFRVSDPAALLPTGER